MDTLAVVLAVDLPLLPWETLHWLVQRAKVSGAAATIPLVAERPQPTCAVYRSALAPALRKQLLAGERKLMRAVEVACTKPNQFDLFDFAAVLPERRRNLLPIWFTNVNTAEDLARAEAVHAAEVHAAKLRSVEARAQQADADRRVW
jgi:molybdopterin-guanine dinucleotide biosynthesis protein A